MAARHVTHAVHAMNFTLSCCTVQIACSGSQAALTCNVLQEVLARVLGGMLPPLAVKHCHKRPKRSYIHAGEILAARVALDHGKRQFACAPKQSVGGGWKERVAQRRYGEMWKQLAAGGENV